MTGEHEDLMVQIDRAYPKSALLPARVDFVREKDSALPKAQVEPDGTVYVTLRSLDWETESRIRLGRPVRSSGGLREWITTGGQIADQMDKAVAELREAPPFYVGDYS